MPKQNTIASPVKISGIALHTGVRATLKILPAPVDHGIVFRRVDMPNSPEVKAHVTNIVDVRLATTIASKTTGAMVTTVEHVMAAMHISGLDNAMIEMDGPEPPITDGSGKIFFEEIQKAGLREQDAEARYFVPKAPIFFEQDNVFLALLPADDLKVSFTVEYGVTPLDMQFFSSVINVDTFREQICGARTFCHYKDLKKLLGMGLGKGGSLDNAVILHEGAIVSKDGLRYRNELVRHKVLDLLGDLYHIGKRVKGHIVSIKSGHPSHAQLVQLMYRQEINQ